MNSKVESFLGCSGLMLLAVSPVILLLAIVVHDKWISGKQVVFDRARASLSAALDDRATGGGILAAGGKQYGAFTVFPVTNNVVVGRSSYALVFVTAGWYDFEGQGRLGVTTNRQFIWLDNRRGAKLVPDDYKVFQWRTGY